MTTNPWARVRSLLAAAGSLTLIAAACAPSSEPQESVVEVVEPTGTPVTPSVTPSTSPSATSSEPVADPEPAAATEDEATAPAEAEPGSADAIDPHADAPLGYAAMNGGTSGGFGGDTVTELVLSEYRDWSGAPTPGQALHQALQEHRKAADGAGLVVYVDVTVTRDQVDAEDLVLKDVSHVSLLGVGDSGELDGIGIGISRSHDIVLRNLTIHHVSEGQGDAVGVAGASTNVWIDHNTFFSEIDGVDKDFYDGLVDIKQNTEYVTVSWNEFHSHWKASLVGHEDNAATAPDGITFHHNRFSDINSRTPLIRAADVHMLNNVFEDIHGSAINARIGARVLVEGNHFDNVGSGGTDRETGHVSGPVGWWYGGDETGHWNLVDNAYVDSPHEHLESTTDFTVPYAYEAQSPEEALAAVEAHAGSGVIDVTSR
ncbi:hypothetical protein PWG71_00705 [Nocardiopsis sp. N85]|uniref:pectate lyase family protein n=1 Tax=Nocardiopsis sp. N85 TaxID=3029400 RepID=UPI00237FC0CA|nr:hypothetical protein [Nocardiopsis sp. N85]MDE3719891.1 hypothetical protein [Nocardiopsis sp. N85]